MGKRLGKKLVALRKGAGLTQDEAAANLKITCAKKGFPENALITRSTLGNYEKGIRTPDYLKMMVIAEFYNTPLQELIYLAALDTASEGYGSTADKNAETNESDFIKDIMIWFNEFEEYNVTGKEDEENEALTDSIFLPGSADQKSIIQNTKAENLVLFYSSREELVLMEKIKRLTSENRKKIEDRIDLLLEMQ